MPDTTDQPLTHDDMDELRAAGASPQFLRVVASPTAGEDLDRNTALEHARRLCEDLEDHPPEKLSEASVSGGDFFRDLWQGELMEAFYRADIENTLLLTRLFTPQEFLAAARDNPRDDAERAKRVLVEKWERHGADGIELPEKPPR